MVTKYVNDMQVSVIANLGVPQSEAAAGGTSAAALAHAVLLKAAIELRTSHNLSLISPEAFHSDSSLLAERYQRLGLHLEREMGDRGSAFAPLDLLDTMNISRWIRVHALDSKQATQPFLVAPTRCAIGMFIPPCASIHPHASNPFEARACVA